MHLEPGALDAFRAHVLSEWPREACGLLVDNVYRPLLNTAPNPTEAFRVSPLDRVQAAGLGTIRAVLHSHPYDLAKPPKYPPEWPSTADMVGWLADSVPWGICATEGEGISELVWLDEEHPEPMVGRQFVHGVNDCYSVVRDWFKQERGIALRNFPRGMEWWNTGADLYDANFESAGFVSIPMEQAAVGDVLLFQVRSPVTNHAAVITGPNEILHHMVNRLSGHDTLAKWQRVINRAVRYVSDQ